MGVMDGLYESKINFSIVTSGDDGIEVWLSDAVNGFVAEAHLEQWAHVEPWLIQQAMLYFPDSPFRSALPRGQG